MALQRLKTFAGQLKPADTKPLRNSPRDEGSPTVAMQPLRPRGDTVWHGVTGNRFSFALPSQAKGPIRARETRRQKGREGY